MRERGQRDGGKEGKWYLGGVKKGGYRTIEIREGGLGLGEDCSLSWYNSYIFSFQFLCFSFTGTIFCTSGLCAAVFCIIWVIRGTTCTET